jgi:predicted nucleic acid-binding Zn finger protein
MEFIDMKSNLSKTNAMVIASKGLVKRTGNYFTIYSDKTGEMFAAAEVKRLRDGAIICSCKEYARQRTKHIEFKCEHILAVKIAIGLRNTEIYYSPAKAIGNVLQFSNKSARFIKETSDIENGGWNLRSMDPAAKTLHDLVTGRQLAMIRDFAKFGNINTDKECDKIWGLMPNELSRTAASAFISYLSSKIPHAAKELNLKHAA